MYMKKSFYESPDSQPLEVMTETGLLVNTVEGMNPIEGSWDEDDDDQN